MNRAMTLLLLVLSTAQLAVLAAPQDGQIAVDPNNPARMVYWNKTVLINGRQAVKPCVFAGPGDPEDFFYNNTAANKNLLISRGARCTYIMAYLADFGGGSPGAGTALDITLNAWEQHITDLEKAGVIVCFFFLDDSVRRPPNWQDAVDKMVAKFKHHKLLIWCVAEEYSEALSKTDVAEVAARIKAQDPYDHLVGVHQHTGTSFDFNGAGDLDTFFIQHNESDPAAIHDGLNNAWNNTAAKKVLNMSEIAGHATKDRIAARKWNWAAVMGGASAVMVLGMGRASDPAANNDPGKYDDCARLMDFFEAADINSMSPHDDLIAGNTKWLLAKPGMSYIAYQDNLTGPIGIKSMSAGTYKLTWYDIANNAKKTEQKTLPTGDHTFTPPPGIGTEVAVWIAKAETGDSAVSAAWKEFTSNAARPPELSPGDATNRNSAESPTACFPPPDSQGGWRTLTNADDIRRIAGMDIKRLDEAFGIAEASTKNGGLLVVRRGWLVYERYFGRGHREATPNLASCGKSFTSIAVGILMAERPDLFPDGLDQKVFTPAYLPPEAFPLSDPAKADIKLGHLLAFSGGIRGNNPCTVNGKEATIEPAGPDGWQAMVDAVALGKRDMTVGGKRISAATLWCPPGGGYSYATASAHVASMIVRRVTGMELEDYVRKRLAEPMGWGRFTYAYRYAKEVTHTPGGGGIAVRATDMLRFGYLLLRNGRWGDRQLVPAEYVRQCGRKSPYNPHYPYSLQFNVNTDGEIPGYPRDAFWKSGSGAHMLYVVPSLDLVVWKLAGRDSQYGESDTGVPLAAEIAKGSASRKDWKATLDERVGQRILLTKVIEAILESASPKR